MHLGYTLLIVTYMIPTQTNPVSQGLEHLNRQFSPLATSDFYRIKTLAIQKTSISNCFNYIYYFSSNSSQGFVTFYKNCAFLLINVTFSYPMCYDARRAVAVTAELNLTHHCLKEKTNE